MVVRKLKVKRIVFAFIFIAIIVIGLIIGINNIKYRNSYEYKFKEAGYNENEIERLLELKDSQKEDILKINYNKKLVSFLDEKYFIFSNLKKYINYYINNNNKTLKDIVSIVNVGADKDFYENIKDTNLEDSEKMLVNKFYALKEDYEPEDLIEISGRYAYDNKYMSGLVSEHLSEMMDAAKIDGYTLIVSQGYRSYKDQKEAYDNYKSYHTTQEADDYAARPGHSEYQTGLSLIIEPYKKTDKKPEETEEYVWLRENAYKYGFILRYPEGKEHITGFKYEPWRYRYVGTEIAQYIFENDITFDEYYAFYLE